jgi:ParB-like chromosome segregation protein Spo0J
VVSCPTSMTNSKADRRWEQLTSQICHPVNSQANVPFRPYDKDLEDKPVVNISVDCLSTADSPRLSGEDPEHVKSLAAVETQLPPIIVHRPTMRVIDGVHRLRVAELRGDTQIAARFFDGDDADAFVLAVKSNIAHGLPLSLADRKAAVARVLVSHPQWSDRMIASVTGVSSWTVGEMRARGAQEGANNGSRMGRDGRVRPLDRSDGRRIAHEVMSSSPNLSLRQVAQIAGISPETVRDVRDRLRRGEDPLPQDRRKREASQKSSDERRQQPGRIAAQSHAPLRNWGDAVGRLRADPALRMTETGRSLLILLQAHSLKQEEWERIIDSIPVHCSLLIARMAKDCAQMWSEFARRVDEKGIEMQ